jgi:anion-transporting  ArsA/GET3 family ATPase
VSARIVICCGSGGVGKTTTSAAIALAAAADGARVAVLTIDPARRLAACLNIESIGGDPTPVPLADTAGSCDAVMLDVSKTFESLIHTFSASPERAAQILNNRYFQFAATRLGGVHEYMAAEKVRELAACGEYDLLVVDTPPTRNALDFLRAPERIAGLMDGAVMRWMAMPATRSGWRALELGSEAVTRVLGTLVGRDTISEIAQFFDLFRDLWDGFLERSLEVQRMLSAEGTSFLLITSPAPTARTEALYFLEMLTEHAMPFGGFVINRTESMPPQSDELLHTLDSIDSIDDVLAAQLMNVSIRQTQLAALHQQSIQSLRSAGPNGAPHWVVPDLGREVDCLDDLFALARHLPGISSPP